MSGPRDTPDRKRSVVYLEVGPLAAFEDGDVAPAELDQRNEAFLPYVLAVRAGATVHFPNHDRIYHNVFSFSKPKRFDLGRYARGQSKAVRFDKPGVVRVFCDIHAHMSAFILVFAHPFFAVTDAEGRYRIPDVPPAATRSPLDRRRAPRDPAHRRPAGRREPRAGLRGQVTMRLHSSLRGRIFLASALVAVLSVAFAIQFVRRRVADEADAELRRSLDRAARLVEQHHASRLEALTAQARLIADLPTLAAAVDTGHPPTVEPIAQDSEDAGALRPDLA